MAHKILVDTDILIDFGLDKSKAVQTMAILEQRYDICVSVINTLELYAGCRSKQEMKEIDELLEDFTLFHITKSISEKALKLLKKFRSSHGVEINDMLIAGTAQINKLKLISKNQKHYQFLPDLDLIEYPLSEV